MPKVRVNVKYVFEGYFLIDTPLGTDVAEIVSRDCGLVMGGGIHTTNEMVKDWNFDPHPEAVIVSVEEETHD